MDSTTALFSPFGVIVPEILLPDAARCDYKKWSVIACDQFTSQASYWDGVEGFVGGAPSALRLILPEIYLSDGFSGRVADIHKKMDEYLQGDVFGAPFEGFMLVERTFCDKGGDEYSRWGLVLAIDLEQYSFAPDAKSLIRSTEETVCDRLPPRIGIRRGAALESPHIKVLVDDSEKLLIEPLSAEAKAGMYEKAYDFELMARGGYIRGYRVCGQALDKIAPAFDGLMQKAKTVSNEPMLFAVGDGNHSLAAAKVFWDEQKSKLPHGGQDSSPARYALVEIINLHSGAVRFEPIHRALYNADPSALISELKEYFDIPRRGELCPPACSDVHSATAQNTHCYEYRLMHGGGDLLLRIHSPAFDLPVAEMQDFLDYFCAKYPTVRIDYIHGEDELKRLVAEEGCFCFLLPPVDKNGFFPAIAVNGPMPRKSFSMGEARDKRYYLEARRIAP